jgi:hypothetical protein
MSDGERPDPIRLSVDETRRMVAEKDAAMLDVVDSHSDEQTEVEAKEALRINPMDAPDEYDRIPQERSVLTY